MCAAEVSWVGLAQLKHACRASLHGPLTTRARGLKSPGVHVSKRSSSRSISRAMLAPVRSLDVPFGRAADDELRVKRQELKEGRAPNGLEGTRMAGRDGV